MKSKINTFLGLVIIVWLLIFSIKIIGFNDLFYHYEFNKNNTVKQCGVDSYDELIIIKNMTLNFLQGKSDNLSYQTNVFNNYQEVYTDYEKGHLVDVADLYHKTNFVFYSSTIIIIFLAFILYHKNKLNLRLGLKNASLLFLGFFIAIAIYALVDFYSFFINLHYLLFDNLNFFLDPSKHLLIRLVPEQFFFDLVIFVLISWLIMIGLINILLHLKGKK